MCNVGGYIVNRLDEVHCGDCRLPAVDQASVDVVFCRCVKGVVGEEWVMGKEGGGGADWRRDKRVHRGGLCCQPSKWSPLHGDHVCVDVVFCRCVYGIVGERGGGGGV